VSTGLRTSHGPAEHEKLENYYSVILRRRSASASLEKSKRLAIKLPKKLQLDEVNPAFTSAGECE
jgi:hypothetical protein